MTRSHRCLHQQTALFLSFSLVKHIRNYKPRNYRRIRVKGKSRTAIYGAKENPISFQLKLESSDSARTSVGRVSTSKFLTIPLELPNHPVLNRTVGFLVNLPGIRLRVQTGHLISVFGRYFLERAFKFKIKFYSYFFEEIVLKRRLQICSVW